MMINAITGFVAFLVSKHLPEGIQETSAKYRANELGRLVPFNMQVRPTCRRYCFVAVYLPSILRVPSS
jgi:hypothetical protein